MSIDSAAMPWRSWPAGVISVGSLKGEQNSHKDHCELRTRCKSAIEFIAENGGGAGVRLSKAQR
jgi:hypothetical protein